MEFRPHIEYNGPAKMILQFCYYCSFLKYKSRWPACSVSTGLEMTSIIDLKIGAVLRVAEPFQESGVLKDVTQHRSSTSSAPLTSGFLQERRKKRDISYFNGLRLV